MGIATMQQLRETNQAFNTHKVIYNSLVGQLAIEQQ
jgi:hypothetical protein